MKTGKHKETFNKDKAIEKPGVKTSDAKPSEGVVSNAADWRYQGDLDVDLE